MIADAADALITISAELQSAQRSQRHGEALSHRNDILQKLLTRAAQARAATRALATRMSEPLLAAPGLPAALEALRQWRSQLDSDLEAALSGDAFPTLRTAAEKAVGQAETQAQSAWRTYLARTSPDIDTDLLDVLNSDPQAGVTVQQIGVLANIVRGFAELPLPTAEQIDQYDTMVADLQSVWSTIDLSSLDDEIVAFLRAANGELGAALSTLTPAVLAWLRERGLADHYVIRPNARR
jgi:hypothetical protein